MYRKSNSATITLQTILECMKNYQGWLVQLKQKKKNLQIYGLKVVVVPTNKPVARVDLTDVLIKSSRAKYKAVVNKIIELFEKGQPVSVGTSSIQSSEHLSNLLKKKYTSWSINAKYHEREAEITVKCWFKTVKLQINMAGRGTDIKLGGDLIHLH